MCDCVNTTVVRGDILKDGTTSCGCVSEDNLVVGREKLREGYVDGTNLSLIKSDIKINSNNKTGVKGVCWSSQKHRYRAHITFKGKVYHLGFYENLEDAAKARKHAEENLFGEFIDEMSK